MPITLRSGSRARALMIPSRSPVRGGPDLLRAQICAWHHRDRCSIEVGGSPVLNPPPNKIHPVPTNPSSAKARTPPPKALRQVNRPTAPPGGAATCTSLASRRGPTSCTNAVAEDDGRADDEQGQRRAAKTTLVGRAHHPVCRRLRAQPRCHDVDPQHLHRLRRCISWISWRRRSI